MSDGLAVPLTTDVARIRDTLRRELETITHYENLAAEATSEDVKHFFLHLAEEEKEHVSEAVHMLRLLDGAQNAHFLKPFDVKHLTETPTKNTAPPVSDLAHVPSEPSRAIYALPAPPGQHSGTFTVGPLKGRTP